MSHSPDIQASHAPRPLEFETRYEILVEHAPIAMCEVSRGGRLRWVNRALVELLGYTSACELLSPDNPAAQPLLIDEAGFSHFASSERRPPVETEWPRKNGQPIWVRLRGRALPRGEMAGEAPETVAIIAEDITERREHEEQRRLAHKLEAVGRLAGGIAHDFNNMLTAILGYSELLLEQLDDQKPIAQDIQEIRRAADRAAALTHQLLAFSRRQVLNLQPLDLNTLVRDMEAMIRRLIGEHITIETRLEDPLPTITADRSLIEQVLVNLALNARDAMPRGGSLTFETSSATLDNSYAMTHEGFSEGEFVRLAVADTGLGMTPETRSKIFDPFFTTKELGQGTGLGLATVYGTVQQLGGYIWVYSELNEGAIFKLYFPQTHATVAQEARPDRHGQPVGSESVLLVEDEGTVRAFCKTVLKRHGYRVVEAAKPTDAFSALETIDSPVHLILTDITMPGMNGHDMVRQLRGTLPAFKTLYMSGYANQFTRRGLDSGIDLIEKPFTAGQLLRRVRQALDRSS